MTVYELAIASAMESFWDRIRRRRPMVATKGSGEVCSSGVWPLVGGIHRESVGSAIESEKPKRKGTTVAANA